MSENERRAVLAEEMGRKLDFEFESFYHRTLCTSKSNIFAISGEIETKKRISKYLRDAVASIETRRLDRMYSHNNLLEECYRYCLDHPEGAAAEMAARYVATL